MSPDAKKIDLHALPTFMGFIRAYVVSRMVDIMCKDKTLKNLKESDILYSFYKNEFQALWSEIFGLQVMAQELDKTIELTTEEEHVIIDFNTMINSYKEQQK